MATTADPRSKPDDQRLLPGSATPFPIPKKCANRRSVHRHFRDRAPVSAPTDCLTIGAMAVLAVPAAIPASGGEEDPRLDELRTKLMGHLREAADRMKVAVEVPLQEPLPPASSSLPADAAAGAASERPWSLRTRKKAPTTRPSQQTSPSAAPAAEMVQRNTRSRSEAAALEERAEAEAAAEKEEEKKKQAWPKVPIALTPEEIEEDIYAITGSRPRRRPKKRPRAVQRELDRLFPGLWLSDITEESYKVEDE